MCSSRHLLLVSFSLKKNTLFLFNLGVDTLSLIYVKKCAKRRFFKIHYVEPTWALCPPIYECSSPLLFDAANLWLSMFFKHAFKKKKLLKNVKARIFSCEDQESFFPHTIVSSFVLYKSIEITQCMEKIYMPTSAHQSLETWL